jgi:uncharacterized protein (DUF302 family)
MNDHCYACRTSKSPSEFADDFRAVAARHGFTIANQETMSMAHTFAAHGVAVTPDFDLHMMQLCKPDKAAASLQANPERAILMPKFVMAFSRDGATQIRFHHYCEEFIRDAVADDHFPASLAATYATIIKMIDEAAAHPSTLQ